MSDPVQQSSLHALRAVKSDLESNQPPGKPHGTCYPRCAECRSYFRGDAYRTWQRMYQSVCRRIWKAARA